MQDFHSRSLEKGDLVLHGQGTEKGQILGELDNLLHHESIDICKVCEQRQHGGQGLERPVMAEQVGRRLQSSER